MKSSKLETTAVAAAAAEAAKHDAHDESFKAKAMHRLAEAQDEVMGFFGVEGWKRTLVAMVTYVAGCAGVIYLGTTITEVVMVGAMSLGISAFIGLVLAVLTACLVAWYGHKVVARVVGAIMTSEADDKAIAAYDATRRLLNRFNPFAAKQPAAA